MVRGGVREVCSRPEPAALRERDDEVQDRILRRLRIRTRSAPCGRQVLSNRRRRGRARQELGRGVRDHARWRARLFEEGVRALPDAGRSGVDCGPPGNTAFRSGSCAGCAWRTISGGSGPKARVRGAVRVQVGMLRRFLKPEIEQDGPGWPPGDGGVREWLPGNGDLKTAPAWAPVVVAGAPAATPPPQGYRGRRREPSVLRQPAALRPTLKFSRGEIPGRQHGYSSFGIR